MMKHADYPHIPGYLIDCEACENSCHCGPGVAAGTDTECVWIGHEQVSFNLEESDNMREFVAMMNSSRCPACGEFPDYCQGHGEIGDPVGYAILEMHETGNHTTCLFKENCE